MTTDPRPEDAQDAKAAPKPERSADAWASAARERADRLHQSEPARRPRAESKAWFQHLPAKLAGAVVFLVAVTTLLGNLLELRDKSRDPPPAPASAPAQSTPAAPARPAPSGPVRARVALDRIAVQDDGSPGTTDWRFTVEADGQPLLAFGQDDLDDTGGRNVMRPSDAAASLRMAAGRPVRLSVKGWRLSRFRLQGEPDAVGEGVLSANGDEAAIRVASREAAGGAFVFYFSADAR